MFMRIREHSTSVTNIQFVCDITAKESNYFKMK